MLVLLFIIMIIADQWSLIGQTIIFKLGLPLNYQFSVLNWDLRPSFKFRVTLLRFDKYFQEKCTYDKTMVRCSNKSKESPLYDCNSSISNSADSLQCSTSSNSKTLPRQELSEGVNKVELKLSCSSEKLCIFHYNDEATMCRNDTTKTSSQVTSF